MNKLWQWLTHKGCPGCGHSRYSKLEKIVFALIVVAVYGGIFTMQACNTDQPSKSDPKPQSKVEDLKEGRAETIWYGYIRSINFENREFVYESDYGFIKTFSRVCGFEPLPIWEGMHVEQINFHWQRATDDTNGCFALDGVIHDLSGKDVPPPTKKVDASGVSK
jgi:hypothetical protein